MHTTHATPRPGNNNKVTTVCGDKEAGAKASKIVPLRNTNLATKTVLGYDGCDDYALSQSV